MDINSLYKLACLGDNQAENHLFEHLSARFRYFVYQKVRDREAANEIVQEALMAIHKEYKDLVINASFTAWAYKVLDNRILNYIGSKKRESEKHNYAKHDPDSSPNSLYNHGYDLKRSLLECLNRIANINLRYARILNLNYQGYSTDEICGKLKLTSTNLYTILSRARSMLELCLETGRID